MIARITMASAESDFDRTTTLIENVLDPDFRPLLDRLREVMSDDMRRMLLLGIDRDESATAPLKDSTLKRGRGGDGPPRAPRGEGSRLATGYVVDDGPDPDGFSLVGHWPGVDFAEFLARGTRNMPPRDMLGITPTGMALVAAELDAFASSLVGAAA